MIKSFLESEGETFKSLGKLFISLTFLNTEDNHCHLANRVDDPLHIVLEHGEIVVIEGIKPFILGHGSEDSGSHVLQDLEKTKDRLVRKVAETGSPFNEESEDTGDGNNNGVAEVPPLRVVVKSLLGEEHLSTQHFANRIHDELVRKLLEHLVEREVQERAVVLHKNFSGFRPHFSSGDI